ncbi:type IV secretion system protein [Ensifer aridi]|uniref:type IV secretion system protein n=1 Tax=Ensifer aridi TaxID=1708715 RepID=UPI000A106126|nr:type IV secretion system protein [Ensifer aridi]
MKALLTSAVVISLVTAPLIQAANAQETQITPLPLPAIPGIPAAPDGAQATFDKKAIEFLMYMVEMSRLIGGGVTQLVAHAQTAEQLLIRIQDATQAQRAAVSGPKSFPVNNEEADLAARKGGLGLREMVDAALNGRTLGPQGTQSAFAEFHNLYRLDDSFALRNDKRLGNVIAAHTSAQGAVTASTADDSYKRANASMDRLNGYVTALESSNDLKTSVDINTRVMIEVAQQLNETLRTQAAIASLTGVYFMAVGADSAEPESLRDLINFNR